MGQLLHSEITQEIIGAAYEVHGVLGPGFLECLYEEAMCHELAMRGLTVARQVEVPVQYKGLHIGKHVLDIIVNDCVVVELKAISELADIHRGILISYLTATDRSVGLLINFGQQSMEFKRVVRQNRSRTT